MAPATRVPVYRRRVFWVVAAVCVGLAVVVPFAVARAAASLSGPPVILPGSGFDAVAVSLDGRTLYAARPGPDGENGEVTPLDTATGRAGRPLAVGGAPQALALTPDARTLFALLDSGLIIPVDLATGKAMTPVRVPGGAAAMTVSPDGRTLWVGTNGNEVVAVDTATRRQGAPVPLPTPQDGEVAPNAMAVTPDGKTVYVADSDDAVIPVSVATGRRAAPIIVGNPALTTTLALAVAPDGRTLYAAVNGDYDDGHGPNTLVVIGTAAGTIRESIPWNGGPIALAVAPGGRTLYVLNGNYGQPSTVSEVSTASGIPGPPIRIGSLFSSAGAFDFAVAPDGRSLYVADGSVVAIRPAP